MQHGSTVIVLSKGLHQQDQLDAQVHQGPVLEGEVGKQRLACTSQASNWVNQVEKT